MPTNGNSIQKNECVAGWWLGGIPHTLCTVWGFISSLGATLQLGALKNQSPSIGSSGSVYDSYQHLSMDQVVAVWYHQLHAKTPKISPWQSSR